MKEGDGTVLDNSMILFGSALSDGDSHNPHKLPHRARRASGGGRIDAGQHPCTREDTPVARTCTCRCWMPSARPWSASPTAPARCLAYWCSMRLAIVLLACALQFCRPRISPASG